MAAFTTRFAVTLTNGTRHSVTVPLGTPAAMDAAIRRRVFGNAMTNVNLAAVRPATCPGCTGPGFPSHTRDAYCALGPRKDA